MTRNTEFNRLLIKSIRALTEEAEAALGTDEFEMRVTELVLQTSILAGHCDGMLDVQPVAVERDRSFLTVVK